MAPTLYLFFTLWLWIKFRQRSTLVPSLYEPGKFQCLTNCAISLHKTFIADPEVKADKDIMVIISNHTGSEEMNKKKS